MRQAQVHDVLALKMHLTSQQHWLLSLVLQTQQKVALLVCSYLDVALLTACSSLLSCCLKLDLMQFITVILLEAHHKTARQ